MLAFIAVIGNMEQDGDNVIKVIMLNSTKVSSTGPRGTKLNVLGSLGF